VGSNQQRTPLSWKNGLLSIQVSRRHWFSFWSRAD